MDADSHNSSYPSVEIEERKCVYYDSYPPIRITLNVWMVLTNILSIVTLVLVRKFNATFVILVAMAGVIAFTVVGYNIAARLDHSLAISVVFSFTSILDGIYSWLMVLLVIFRFYATRSASGLGEGWRSGRRALIGIGIVSAAVTIVTLPVIIELFVRYSFVFSLIGRLIRFLFMSSIPGLMMVGFGGALLLNYYRPPGHIIDSEQGRSYGTVDHTGRAAGQQAKDRELERELTRTVLGIVLLNGIIFFVWGIVYFLASLHLFTVCGLNAASYIFGWITSVLPSINFFLYLLLLSDFRAVYSRCCCRRM